MCVSVLWILAGVSRVAKMRQNGVCAHCALVEQWNDHFRRVAAINFKVCIPECLCVSNNEVATIKMLACL
jgi:hypothetical protein